MIVANIFLEPRQESGLALWNHKGMIVTDVLQRWGIGPEVFELMSEAMFTAVELDDDLIQLAKTSGVWYEVAFKWDKDEYPDINPDGPWLTKYILRLVRLRLIPGQTPVTMEDMNDDLPF